VDLADAAPVRQLQELRRVAARAGAELSDFAFGAGAGVDELEELRQQGGDLLVVDSL
jgi:hypothetical protein